MIEERTHHATVRLVHGFEFVAEFSDPPGASPLVFDEPAPLGTSRAPNAAAVLGAAIGNCLAASLTFCLRRARLDVQGMTAEVTTHVERNEKGRYRVSGIDVDLSPVVGTDPSALVRCEELFEDFCVVSASVRHAIPIRVSLKSDKHEPVPSV